MMSKKNRGEIPPERGKIPRKIPEIRAAGGQCKADL